jgi:hypothetical protein
MGRYDFENLYPETPTEAPAAAPQGGSRYDFEKLYPASDTTAQEPQVTYRGSVLPFTRYSDDTVKFDPLGAGPIGSLYGMGKDFVANAQKAVTLPGRVLLGETQMPPLGASADDPRAQAMAGEALNFATMFSPINPAVRAGDRIIPGVTRTAPDMSRATVPSWQELKQTGGAQHDAVRDMVVPYNPQHLPVLADKIEQRLIKDGVFPEDAKGIYETLNRMRAVPSSTSGETIHFEPANLISLRKNIANKFEAEGENKHAVSVALKHIDDFIENPPASAVLGGPAAQQAARQAGELYTTARANSAAGFRGEELGKIDYASGLRTGSAGSGQNLGNTVRSQVTNAILNAKRLKGFTPEEIAKLEAIPEGTPGRNVRRFVGNLMGGGGGPYSAVAGALAGGGAHMLGLGPELTSAAMVGTPIIGGYLKNSVGKSTAEALREVERETRMRSPLFREQVAGQDLVPGNPGRDAMARFLLNRATQPSAPPSFSRPPNVRPEDYI